MDIKRCETGIKRIKMLDKRRKNGHAVTADLPVRQEDSMTIEEMLKRKIELGYSNETIAERSGVPLGTVQKIFGGQTHAPRYKTIMALERVLNYPQRKDPEPARNYLPEQAVRENERYQTEEVRPSVVRESQPILNPAHRGQYTLADYYALPAERRAELIDGVLYDMAAPTKVHQLIMLKMALQLEPCVSAHPGCQLFVAPLDVCLDNDKYTVVQPDVLIVCREDGDIRRVNGAPDFVAEILSPSSRSHDLYRKQYKYREAGVREYWIVDPERGRVVVFDFENEALPETYSFSDSAPLRISGGKCAVSFAAIAEAIQRYE